MMKATRLLTTALLLLTLNATAQEPSELTLDRMFGDDAINLNGNPQGGFDWIDDSHFLWPRTDEKGDLVAIVSVNAASGKETILVDPASIAEHVDEDVAKSLRRRGTWVANSDGTAFLLGLEGDIWVYESGSDAPRRLTETESKEETVSWSPDGKLIGFTRDHDLWVLDPSDGTETRLTTGGTETRLNGILDWVYQEEIYGRGRFKGYWWSEDSNSLAFLSLDETPVDTFRVVNQIPYLQDVETMRYPKAGSDNPIVSLHVVSAEGAEVHDIDLGQEDDQILVVNVSWSPDHEVLFEVQDRTQTWLELRSASRDGGSSTLLIREDSPAWVDNLATPYFLPNGTFLWESERDGWRHLYQYSKDGKLLRRVTEGEWEVRDLHGTDEGETWVYFSGTERSPIGLDVYRIRIDGSGLERLSDERGWHGATFNSSCTWYLDQWSNIESPQQVRLHDGSGKAVRVVDENPVAALESIDLAPVRFVTIPNGGGFEMESMLIEPVGMEDGKRYPVYQYIYGGPHAQQVVDRWQGRGERFLFYQFLVRNGVGVWVMDNRTASGKGAVSTREVYEHFGKTELEDVEDGLEWLKNLSWVDPDRIVVSGWSYGGFMTLYLMTHSEAYAAGIAGGSVTDWRDYDTVYTERYMGLPSENEEGYRDSSPRNSAADLHGTVLLIHGTIDDNVHMQNTMQMALELQKAEKDFRMMLYPKSRHGIRDEALRKHLYLTMWRFIQDMVIDR